MKNLKRILVADDNVLVFHGIQKMLSDLPLWTVTEYCNTFKELFNLLARKKPNIVLLDPVMSGSSGFAFSEKIKKDFSEVKVIAFSNFHGKENVKRAMSKNIDGYLLKSADKDELVHCLETVMKGKKYISTDVSLAQLTSQYRNIKLSEGSIGPKRISKREMDVLKLISVGKSNKEIAKELFLSVKTIETHRSHLLKKTNSHNTAEMLSVAYKKGWVES